MTYRVVIVGAGLGGCLLAHALGKAGDIFDLTVVERTESQSANLSVRDIGLPAITEPHIASGLGGTTQLWHNGLIEIDETVFTRHWPFAKSELDRHIESSFELLSSGVSIGTLHQAIADLRSRFVALGLPQRPWPGLFYPRWPLNAWKALKLSERVRLVRGEVHRIECQSDGIVQAVWVSGPEGMQRLEGDVFILAAGGLGTPLLLQSLAREHPWPSLAHAGCHYEDHPMAFVGEVQVNAPLYRLWNFPAKGTGGTLRVPIVVEEDALQVSFQLRPAATYYRSSRRERVGSVLNELRRNPWNPLLYLRLLKHWDDILDILSFKFGIRVPTRHYTLLMVAQMPVQPERSISGGDDGILRQWQWPPSYPATLERAITRALQELGPLVKKSRIFPGWMQQLRSSAHHSGTARLSIDPNTGVCDVNAKVHGTTNLYVCDGSLIPASGIANTGLTIGALAFRLADHLISVFGRSRPAQ
jgi:hypothetical protein